MWDRLVCQHSTLHTKDNLPFCLVQCLYCVEMTPSQIALFLENLTIYYFSDHYLFQISCLLRLFCLRHLLLSSLGDDNVEPGNVCPHVLWWIGKYWRMNRGQSSIDGCGRYMCGGAVVGGQSYYYQRLVKHWHKTCLSSNSSSYSSSSSYSCASTFSGACSSSSWTGCKGSSSPPRAPQSPLLLNEHHSGTGRRTPWK